MVDVDRRPATNYIGQQQQAHIAGLKRFSARAYNMNRNVGQGRQGGLSAGNSPRMKTSHNFSFSTLVEKVMETLRKGKVPVESGLTEAEMCRIEAQFSFTFPPDLKAILQAGLPTGAGFPDWRSGGRKHLRMMLHLPVAGLCYEVARGRFWIKQWGHKPAVAEDAVAVARAAIRKAPVLIPIYRHCYIPASPNLAGNPVLFIFRKQVIYCGSDLANFFENQDFGASLLHRCGSEQKQQLPSRFTHLETLSGTRADQSLRTSLVWPTQGTSSRRNKVASCKAGLLARLYSCEEEGRSEYWYPTSEDQATSSQSSEAAPWINMPGLDHASTKTEGVDGSLPLGFDLQNIKTRPGRITSQELHNLLPSAESLNSQRTGNVFSVCRRIEFWSDLAEKRLNDNLLEKRFNGSISQGFPESPDNQSFYSAFSSDSESPCSSRSSYSTLSSSMDSESSSSSSSSSFACSKFSKRSPTPYWLERYFDKMSTVLRNEGWKEQDLAEMFALVSSQHDDHQEEPELPIDPQIVTEGLVLYVNLLSDVLRSAGWSTSDVSEAFDVDLSVLGQKKRHTSVPSHIGARVCKMLSK